METIKRFIKAHPIYSLGYGVSLCTYFSYHGAYIMDVGSLKALVIHAGISCIVALSSWFYVAERIINTFCG